MQARAHVSFFATRRDHPRCAVPICLTPTCRPRILPLIPAPLAALTCWPPAAASWPQISGAAQPQGSSARDLMQPAFALVAAEAAWRCSSPARYVSPETISTVATAGEQRARGEAVRTRVGMSGLVPWPLWCRRSLGGGLRHVRRRATRYAPSPRCCPAAPVWSWRVVRHRDSPALASLKLATAAALEELMPHSPRDLPPSAFGKLKTSASARSRQLPRG